MIPLIFLSLIVTIADIHCLINVKISPRIVHGTDASESEFPYAVSLRYNSSHMCGGTILNEKFILTAAHCVCVNNTSLMDYLSIQYGLLNISEEPVNTIKVADIICNDYSPSSKLVINDAALLHLEQPLPKGNWAPVKLAKEFITSKGNRNGTIIGWGKLGKNSTTSMTLQKLNVKIYDDMICGKIVSLKHSICFGALNSGACNGDSGGALIVDGVQVGIASYITNECGIADEDTPNVYARISTYYDWIMKYSRIDNVVI